MVLSDSIVSISTAWLDNDTILAVVQKADGIVAVPASGGVTRRIFNVDSADDVIQQISPVPGSDAVILTVVGDHQRALALDLRTGRTHDVQPGAVAAWVVDGWLVYAQDNGVLSAVPFDAHRLVTAGSPTTVLDSVEVNFLSLKVAIGPDGTLLYVPASADAGWLARSWFAYFGRTTRATRSGASCAAVAAGRWTRPLARWFARGSRCDRPRLAARRHLDSRRRGPRAGPTDVRRLAEHPPVVVARRKADPVSNAGSSVLRLWSKSSDGRARRRSWPSDPRGIMGGAWSPDGHWIVSSRTNTGTPGRRRHRGDAYRRRHHAPAHRGDARGRSCPPPFLPTAAGSRIRRT